MKPRLVYVVGQLGSGGQERQLYYLLQAMDRQRYQPAVVVWNFDEDAVYVAQTRKLGVPLHTFSNVRSGWQKLGAFRRFIQQIQPEVVHSCGFYTNFATWWATRGTSAIAIGAVRSNFSWAREMVGPVLGRLSARWPRRQVFNSLVAAEDARRIGGLFVPQDLFVVRNRLDLEQFPVCPATNGQRPHLLGIGSLVPVKRWDRLLDAAADLKQQGFDFELQIAGDGPLRESLEQHAQAAGLSECVKFLGYRSDTAELLAKAQCLVHPSDSEGCPNVVMEAMACGRPVIATAVGDIPELIDNGTTGFLVPRGDTQALTQRLAQLWTNADEFRRMGQAGREKAEREFGIERLVEETLTVYRFAGWQDSAYKETG